MNSLDLYYSMQQGDQTFNSHYDWCDCGHSLSVGAIIGIAAGGVGFIVILVLLGYCCASRSRKKRLLI